ADAAAKDTRGNTALDFSMQRALPETIKALGGTPVKKNALAAEERDALPSVRESVSHAMALLDAAGPKFFKANGCISCHNQSIPQMAAAALRTAGIKAQTVHSKYVIGEFGSTQDARWETECVSA